MMFLYLTKFNLLEHYRVQYQVVFSNAHMLTVLHRDVNNIQVPGCDYTKVSVFFSKQSFYRAIRECPIASLPVSGATVCWVQFLPGRVGGRLVIIQVTSCLQAV